MWSSYRHHRQSAAAVSWEADRENEEQFARRELHRPGSVLLAYENCITGSRIGFNGRLRNQSSKPIRLSSGSAWGISFSTARNLSALARSAG
jgi:hypothetical protein